MFKLPNIPSPDAELHEIADFAELSSWKFAQTSIQEILAAIGKINDEEMSDGIEDDEDRLAQVLDEVMQEIQRRDLACKGNYPFKLDNGGAVLRHMKSAQNPGNRLYRYLLLCTRISMDSTNKIQSGIDGTLLFEEIGAAALKDYLGGERAQSYVFGTSSSVSGFGTKVHELCNLLHEGLSHRVLKGVRLTANDGNLDAVAWLPLSDSLPGQIIAFAQCKTGTSWGESLTQLQPDGFIEKWILEPFLVKPVRVLCLAEAIDRSRWKEICIDAGVILDRCRLVDVYNNIDRKIEIRMMRWVASAEQLITYQ